jgi:hypothetical protein
MNRRPAGIIRPKLGASLNSEPGGAEFQRAKVWPSTVAPARLAGPRASSLFAVGALNTLDLLIDRAAEGVRVTLSSGRGGEDLSIGGFYASLGKCITTAIPGPTSGLRT